MEWPGPGRDRVDLGTVCLEIPERLWGLEVLERQRVIRITAENCPFAEYFKIYFITFQILF